jgi:hypothetical protein
MPCFVAEQFGEKSFIVELDSSMVKWQKKGDHDDLLRD